MTARGGVATGTPPLSATRPVRRAALLARLRREGGPSIAIVSGPAGSGKSTLLRQWASEDPRPTAWLDVTPEHADPVRLLADLAGAIATALPDGPVGDVAPRLLGSDGMRDQARLTRALVADGRTALVIVDDVHRLWPRVRALDALVGIADRVPAGWTVAIGQRGVLDLPIARWSLQRSTQLVEYPELALSAAECARVLESLGVTATDALVAQILARTEGWAAGVYLSGLSLRADRPLDPAPLVAGDDRLIRSYLDTEILAGIDPGDRDLLRRTAIVDEVSGPLAEAITDVADAGDRLHRLARQSLFLVAVDRRELWFRPHSLLRDRLLRELADTDVDQAALHARASSWFEAHGRLDDAVTHAFQAGDQSRLLDLVVRSLQSEYRAGRIATYRIWLDRLGPSTHERDPRLARSAALFAAVEGDAEEAARWAAVARLADRSLDAPGDDDDLDAPVVRAMLCPDGPERMREDALAALEAHGQTWRWRTTGLLALGAAELMLGDPVAAMRAFEALEEVPGAESALARLAARGERALDAMAHRAWAEADRLLLLDRRVVLQDEDGGRISGTIWLIADVRLLIHRGDIRTAQERLRRLQLGRTRLTWALPWYAVRCLALLAATQLQLGDSAGARASLAQAREVIHHRPLLGAWMELLASTQKHATRAPGTDLDGSSLSPAELRLLPFLQTYLSFKEIGERLGISGNTVKTEAMSIYAKVGATSRSGGIL